MAKFDKIIIVSDIDGTFLGKNSRIVSENVDAIKYFVSNGGKFTFVSGRTPVELKRMIPIAGELVNIPVGCCNGVYLCDINTFEVMHDSLLDSDVAYEMLKYSLSFKNRSYDVLMAHGWEFYAFTQTEFDFVKDYPENCHLITIEQAKITPFNKIVFVGPENDVERASKLVSENFGNKTDCVRSLPIAREFVPKGKAKNVAVEELKKKFPHHRIFAIGDYENDTEMLKIADVAVCPANALDNVKALCSIQTHDHDNGAVADLIHIIEEKYIG